MALTILARLNAQPEPTVDGSSVIAHDISTLWIDDIGENPYIHKTVDVPVEAFQAIAALPVNQRVAAYIAAIREFFFAQRVPLPQPGRPGGLDDASLLAYIAEYNTWKAEFDGNNEECTTWTGHVIDFLDSLNLGDYPVAFTLYAG